MLCLSVDPGRAVKPRGTVPRGAGRVPRSPIAAIRPPRIPTSARTTGVPSPFRTDPPVITMSYGCCAVVRAHAEARRRQNGAVETFICARYYAGSGRGSCADFRARTCQLISVIVCVTSRSPCDLGDDHVETRGIGWSDGLATEAAAALGADRARR